MTRFQGSIAKAVTVNDPVALRTTASAMRYCCSLAFFVLHTSVYVSNVACTP